MREKGREIERERGEFRKVHRERQARYGMERRKEAVHAEDRQCIKIKIVKERKSYEKQMQKKSSKKVMECLC